MPVDRGGDSKQGLVISVVFLSILVIALGVTTFMGYHGRKELVEAAATKEAAANAEKKAAEWQKFKAVQLAAFVGVASPSDLEDLAKLRGDYDKGELKDDVEQAAFSTSLSKLDDPQNGPGWDKSQKKPINTLLGQVAALTNELKNQKSLYEKAERENKANIDELTQRLQRSDATVASLQTQLSESKKQTADAINDKGKAFAQLTEQDAQSRQEKEDAQKAAQNEIQGREKTISSLKHDVKELERGTEKLRSQLTPVDVTTFEHAKGKIISVRNGFAYINLGQADNVKADLTFSVYRNSADGRAQGERKAALEVVSVVGPHVSAARITETRDPSRDPIMPDDLIFNPVWSPSLREHVAIAGLIDLMGDGRDNTQEFVHSLQAQGIVVDAYLDLRDMTIKGNGMTMQTNYLVVGENPDFGVAAQTGKGNANTERKKDVLEQMGKMRTEAEHLGIQVLGARRFMTLIGYKLPTRMASPDYDARPQGVGSLEAPSDTGVSDRDTPATGKAKAPPKKNDDDSGGDKDK